jgi:hypothetical protein
MKKLIILITIIFAAVYMYGQVGEPKQDTTKIRIGSRTIIIVEDKTTGKAPEVLIEEDTEIGEADGSIEIDPEVRPDTKVDVRKKIVPKYDASKYSRWTGFNLGFNQLINNSDFSALTESQQIWDNKPWSSNSWNINIIGQSLSIVKRHLLLTTGIGFEFRNFNFIDDFNLDRSESLVYHVPLDYELGKNSLRSSYVQVPILLEINTSKRPKKGLYLAGGLIGGYKMGSSMQQKYELDGQKYKIKIKDNKAFNLNPFQLMATARIGFNRITLFANADLLPVFKTDKVIDGNDLGNLSIGLQILAF